LRRAGCSRRRTVQCSFNLRALFWRTRSVGVANWLLFAGAGEPAQNLEGRALIFRNRLLGFVQQLVDPAVWILKGARHFSSARKSGEDVGKTNDVLA
jgi:hypothetical protein